ncbi:hypothetical protein MSAN_01102800 [Mycena sanguinolenta]|uniref:Uncharacterized protein n=1 Tax=Mycena sanguinolenta TaxID=230812 RepID=A0A8H7D6T7_9AGAR|nr:hypothetical protein MSAN_01102800 [Mycena sanguinolenta]
MPSTRLSAGSTPVEKPPQQRSVSARSHAHVARELELGAKRGGSGSRKVNNYISGMKSQCSGGAGGWQGGAGGTGEGPTLHYDIRGERIVMKTFHGPEATPPDFLRIPLGHIDLRSEIRMEATTGVVRRYRKQKTVRQMYSARVVGHNEPMTVALYQGNNAEEVQIFHFGSTALSIHVFERRSGTVIFLAIQAFGIPTSSKSMQARVHLEFMLQYFMMAVFGTTLCLDKTSSAAPWFTQANYIFSQLKIVSNHEDYKLVNRVIFALQIGEITQNPPDGYLFVCSPEDFEIGPTSVQWPDRPAYWSLNPSGSNPLSHEEASSLGFPSITPITEVFFSCWDETVYAGLRKFDECKGFDPESQDLAKELGCPLFEICVPGESRELDWTSDENNETQPSGCNIDGAPEMEYNSDLASPYIEDLAMEDENFLQESPSDESDCSNSYPEDGVPEIESNSSSCNQELTVENEDSLRDLPSHGTVVVQHYSIGELAELVKFGLIVVFGLTALYEYAGVLF